MSGRKPGIREIDMLHGPLWNRILQFTIPIAITQILGQLFNSVDLAVVGRCVDKNAMAAVGANSVVVMLVVSLFFGVSVGSNVVIANLIGEGDREKVSKAAASSVSLSLIFGLFLMTAGQWIARPILSFMSTPESILDMAVLYLRIYLLGMPVILLYNFESAIFRAKGNTSISLAALLLGGIANVFLNLFFVIVMKMSVAGVAWATVISNGLSALLLLAGLLRDPGLRLLEYLKKRPDPRLVIRILRIGLPAGIQGMVYALSNIAIQSAFNSLGQDVIAASSAAWSIENIPFYAYSSFGQACTTFIGQNYGAGNPDRCRRTFRTCLLLDVALAVTLSAVIVLFGSSMVGLFSRDPNVIQLGHLRLVYIMAPSFLCVVTDIISGAMRGYGRSLEPALINLIGICGIRVGWSLVIFRIWHTFPVLMMAYGAGWIVTSAVMAFAYRRMWRRGNVFPPDMSRRQP